MNEPRTDHEWQDAVDAAKGMLAVDAARTYGLVDGGPPVNVDRCNEILLRGAARGIVPSPTAIEQLAAEVAGGLRGEPGA